MTSGDCIAFPNGRAPESNGLAVCDTGNVRILHHPDSRLPPNEKAVLYHAEKDGLSDVIVIGYSDDTLEIRSAARTRREILWMLECAKQQIMDF